MTSEPIYRDATRPVEERAADLLERMTLEEKLAQLGSFWVFEILDHGAIDPVKAERILARGIGQVTRVHGASNLPPRAAAQLANAIQRYLREQTRLGIPAIVHEECLHGIVGRDRVCYPQSIGLASTWDPELVGRMAGRMGRQLRAGGAHQALAPILDVTREPRWGRLEETFGEDAYLVAALGLEYVRAIQGGDRGWGPDGVIATSKHMVGHGLPEGGFNHAPAHIGSRELRDVFLFPFEVAVRVGDLHSVMHAYDDVDGIPCVASRELLTTILREEWGFEGIVVSDYAGIELLLRSHQVVSDLSGAAVLALEAGVDSDLPSTRSYGQPLADALAAGAVDIATIDQAVLRTLLVKLRLGLFEQPFVDEVAAEPSDGEVAADRALARELGRRSIVVLKNEGILPLAATGTIAVIGANADSARDLMGDYSHVAHVESLIEIRKRAHYAVLEVPEELEATGLLDGRLSVLDAIRGRVPAGVSVTYARGTGHMDGTDEDIAAAAELARGADVAIVVVGERSGLIDDCQSGESRDRMDIGLPGRQAELVAAVGATGTPIVLVLVAGRPLAIPDEAAASAAVLHAWMPGDEGAAAITDILFGDAEPSGRLPVTVPRSVGQVPIYHGHKPSGGHSNWKGDYVDGSNLPLWPFGFGLSYTTFDIGTPRLDHATLPVEGEVTLTVAVTNTGSRPGAEVVQLYLRDVEASVTRPVQQLCAFAHVELEPGQTRQVSFTIAADQLAFTGVDGRSRVEPGALELMVGRSSADIDHTVALQVTGDVRLLEHRERYLAQVHIGA